MLPPRSVKDCGTVGVAQWAAAQVIAPLASRWPNRVGPPSPNAWGSVPPPTEIHRIMVGAGPETRLNDIAKLLVPNEPSLRNCTIEFASLVLVALASNLAKTLVPVASEMTTWTSLRTW